jgi:hypothetical protein
MNLLGVQNEKIMKNLIISLFLCLLIINPCFGDGKLIENSFIPNQDLEKFIIQRLDLSTFRNSLGPRRESNMRFFSDFGIKATKISNGYIEFDSSDWVYAIEIIRKKDENSDGIEDLVISFFDKSKTGTYDTNTWLLVTRFSEDGNLIALSYEPNQ